MKSYPLAAPAIPPPLPPQLFSLSLLFDWGSKYRWNLKCFSVFDWPIFSQLKQKNQSPDQDLPGWICYEQMEWPNFTWSPCEALSTTRRENEKVRNFGHAFIYCTKDCLPCRCLSRRSSPKAYNSFKLNCLAMQSATGASEALLNDIKKNLPLIASPGTGGSDCLQRCNINFGVANQFGMTPAARYVYLVRTKTSVL